MHTSLQQAAEHTHNIFLTTDTNKQINIIEHETREGGWGFVNNKELSGPTHAYVKCEAYRRYPIKPRPRSASALVPLKPRLVD
jgi:hypothetical protein